MRQDCSVCLPVHAAQLTVLCQPVLQVRVPPPIDIASFSPVRQMVPLRRGPDKTKTAGNSCIRLGVQVSPFLKYLLPCPYRERSHQHSVPIEA